MISDILPMGRGLYRRLGLSPDPEDSGRKCMEKFLLFQVNAFRQLADFVLQVFGNAEFVAAPDFYPSQYLKLDSTDSQFDARIIANELKHLGVHWIEPVKKVFIIFQDGGCIGVSDSQGFQLLRGGLTAIYTKRAQQSAVLSCSGTQD